MLARLTISKNKKRIFKLNKFKENIIIRPICFERKLRLKIKKHKAYIRVLRYLKKKKEQLKSKIRFKIFPLKIQITQLNTASQITRKEKKKKLRQRLERGWTPAGGPGAWVNPKGIVFNKWHRLKKTDRDAHKLPPYIEPLIILDNDKDMKFIRRPRIRRRGF